MDREFEDALSSVVKAYVKTIRKRKGGGKEGEEGGKEKGIFLLTWLSITCFSLSCNIMISILAFCQHILIVCLGGLLPSPMENGKNTKELCKPGRSPSRVGGDLLRNIVFIFPKAFHADVK